MHHKRRDLMAKILIVEDELLIAKGLSAIIHSIDKEIEVRITGYAKEALNYVKQDDYDVLLLDIQLNDYSGLTLARQIREIDQYKLIPILFITAIPTRELMAFKEVHCYDYIVKPFKEEEVRTALETIIYHGIQKQHHEKKHIQIRQKGYYYLIKQIEIKYIEAVRRKIRIITANEEIYLSNHTLKEIGKELNPCFIQCHRGYIINIDYVKKINRTTGEIYLQDVEMVIPIGRTYIENLRGIQLWE